MPGQRVAFDIAKKKEAIIWIRVHGGGVASRAEAHFRAKWWRTRPVIASVSTVQDGSHCSSTGGHTVRPGDREAKSQGEGGARVDRRDGDGSL
ncbi:hypothetical protein GQ600_26954 [Phytophthora cactorum]|nr:hypothetical protein GQ600_26954 [Phytophthora cactorum]